MVFAIGILVACKNDIKDVESLTKMDNLPLEVSKDVKMFYSQEGVVTAMIEAPIMERYVGDEEYTLMPKGVYLETYDSTMKITSTLKSDYAINRTAIGIIEAKGNVQVVNEKGEQLNTEELFWDSKTEKITTDKYVKITTEDEIIEGDGLESNKNFSEYTIKRIRGSISLEDAEGN